MLIELIHTAGCSQCSQAHHALKQIASTLLGETLNWKEINVLDDLTYAISLGVLTLPAIAINGKLIFTSLPTPEKWHDFLMNQETV